MEQGVRSPNVSPYRQILGKDSGVGAQGDEGNGTYQGPSALPQESDSARKKPPVCRPTH